MSKNSAYLVSCFTKGYDSCYSTKNIFVTCNKKEAYMYRRKYNRILKKWKNYYKQYEETKHGFTWIKDEYVEKHLRRWNALRNIDCCDYSEIEMRGEHQ